MLFIVDCFYGIFNADLCNSIFWIYRTDSKSGQRKSSLIDHRWNYYTRSG